MKKLKLFLHPCYGKCGTTFLQENIFLKLKISIFRKPFKNKKLKDFHEKVFIPNYIELKNNSSKLNYKFRYLCKEIIKKFNLKKKNIILSDENIFDFFNFDEIITLSFK